MAWSSQQWESAYVKALKAFTIIVGSGIILSVCLCLLALALFLRKHKQRPIHCYMLVQVVLTMINEVLIFV